MRVILLTIHDQSAHGARCLAAAARQAGHEVLLITFKRFLIREVSREDCAEREAIAQAGHLPAYDVTPHTDVACPYPTPVTDIERDLLLGRIETFGPQVIGFSLTSAHLSLARDLSRLIRTRFPELRQVWGGIHPTMAPAECLEQADAVCIGEGDDAFVEYLDDPGRTDIRNFHFRDRSSGRIVENPLRPLIQDLDRLPVPLFGENEILIDENREQFPTDFSNREGAYAHLVITSQRGCPFRCSYCLHSVLHGLYPHQKYLRRQSVDRFLDEVALRVAQYRPESLFFWDEIFMIGEEWIAEFCEKYPQRIGIPFGGYAHPLCTTPGMLRQLKAAGCAFVALGIQSGSERVTREIYQRPVPNRALIQFGKDLVEAGFEEKVVYDLLTSCPFETEADRRETILLLSRMPKAGHIILKRLVLFPFTPICNLQAPHMETTPRQTLFHDMLCLLAGLPGVPPEILPALADDLRLRQHPEIIECWARNLWDRKNEAEALKRQIAQTEAKVPWGLRRASRHWIEQLRNALRRHGNSKK